MIQNMGQELFLFVFLKHLYYNRKKDFVIKNANRIITDGYSGIM